MILILFLFKEQIDRYMSGIYDYSDFNNNKQNSRYNFAGRISDKNHNSSTCMENKNFINTSSKNPKGIL